MSKVICEKAWGVKWVGGADCLASAQGCEEIATFVSKSSALHCAENRLLKGATASATVVPVLIISPNHPNWKPAKKKWKVKRGK